jgi:iron(III) transport system substrate-binding protein
LHRLTIAACLVALAALAAACGSEPAEDGSERLTIYSGREEDLVAPLLQQFETTTGIDIEVRYGDSAELAATIAEEGENSPADVFFAQDAGALGAVAGEGLLERLPADLVDRVDERFRDPAGHWVGTSGRARVLAYNTDELSESELPDSVWDLTDPQWKGKIGLPPTNASFQSFVSALALEGGADEAERWLRDLQANDPSFYENNTATEEAIAKGEILVGLVNHYYLYQMLEEDPGAPLANHFLAPGDPGSLVNVAGIGVLAGNDNPRESRVFADFLLSADAQQYFADATAEYPLTVDAKPRPDLPPLDEVHGPDIRLGELGDHLQTTLELLNELGYTS